MNHGSHDHIPSSSLILFASIVFTLITYFTFNSFWEVAIPVPWVGGVLGLQFAALLLGRSKVLTQLGAASLSALIAVGAGIGAVFLTFPPMLELRIAGAVGAGSALVFILFSFVAASRVDPVPVRAFEPLVIGEIEDDKTAELIKYGEVRPDDDSGAHDPQLHYVPKDEAPAGVEPFQAGHELLPIVGEKIYEFDEIPESKMGLFPGAEDTIKPTESEDSEEESLSKLLDEILSPESDKEPQPELQPAPSDKPVVPGNWVEDTARIMAYDAHGSENGEVNSSGAASEETLEEEPAATKGISGFRMRTRYKVIDAASGEHYGTYHGDEGYSTLDLVSLSGLLSSKMAPGELRIVQLDWSNFDEVEVHIKLEELVPMDQDVTGIGGIPESGISPDLENASRMESVPNAVKASLVDDPEGEAGGGKTASAASSSGPRYMIYDRRTIQPMGQYVPEGDRSRIDRLSLYKMFPEYNFKTFEIDSVRWEAGEVRIFIKGEKKSPKSKVQRSKKV